MTDYDDGEKGGRATSWRYCAGQNCIMMAEKASYNDSVE